MDMTSSNKPHYRFPILKNNEIIECLTDAGIEVTSNELTEPNRHKEKIKAIYNELVIFGLNLPKDTFTTTSMSLMKTRQNLPHPELHEESFSNLKFIKALTKLMLISGINDFGMQDLYSPTPKRFRRHLSGIINYIKFSFEKQSTFINEINEQKEELIGELLSIQQEQDTLNQQLHAAKEDAEKRWNEARVVDDDCGEIEVEIAKQNKLQTAIRQESENLKKKQNVLKDKIATAELVIQELGVKERKLSSQVVESPDSLKEENQFQSTQLEQERKLCDDAEQKAKGLNRCVSTVIKAQDDVSEITAFMKQVVGNKKLYDQANEESKTNEEKLGANESEAENMKHICEDLEVQLQDIVEKTNNYRQQSKTKLDASKATLHAVNAELLIVERDRRDANAKVEQCEEEVQLLKRVIDEEKVKTDQEIEEIIWGFRKMEKVMMDKIDKFDRSIEEQKQCV